MEYTESFSTNSCLDIFDFLFDEEQVRHEFFLTLSDLIDFSIEHFGNTDMISKTNADFLFEFVHFLFEISLSLLNSYVEDSIEFFLVVFEC